METAAESEGDRTATSEAADWLHDYLTSQGGTAESGRVKTEGAQAGHSASALKRARHRLHVASEGRGFPRKTYWLLPSSGTTLGRLRPTEPAGPAGPAGGGETTKDQPTTTLLVQSDQLVQSDRPPARVSQLETLPKAVAGLGGDPPGVGAGREREEL